MRSSFRTSPSRGLRYRARLGAALLSGGPVVTIARVAGLCALTATLWPSSALAIGEVSGRIGGTVLVEGTNDGLEGVTLTVRGPNLPGGPQTTTTDSRGNYLFQNLPAGAYELTAKVEGFETIRQTRIQVNAGQLAPVDVRLQVTTAPTETVKVIEKTNPVLNAESAVTVTNFNNETLTRVPTFRQFQSVAQFTPGVAQGTDRASVRGGLGRFNKFLVDGLDTSDIVTGGISSPMNFDSAEQFNVMVGAMDAEYNSLGLVQNIVTRSGGDKWVVDASAILQPTQFALPSTFIANSGIQNGGTLYNDPDRVNPVKIFYSGNFNVGGPIVKQRLWFFASFQMNYNRGSTAMPGVTSIPVGTITDPALAAQVQSRIASNYAGILQPYDRYQDTYTYLGRLKLTWQATASTRLQLSFNIDRNYIRNDSSSPSLLPEADRRTDRGGHWVVLLWDTLITPKLLFQMQTGLTHKFTMFDTMAQLPGSPGTPDRITAAHNVPSAGITYLNSGSWQEEQKINVQANPSLLYTLSALGTHNLKFGAQFSYMRYANSVGNAGGRRYTDNIFGLPCDATWIGNSADPGAPKALGDASNGTAANLASCRNLTEYPQSAPIRDAAGNLVAGPGNQTVAEAYNIGFFAQDRWTIKRWLTIVPGFRVDVGILRNAIGQQLLVGYGPRLSVVYDLFHDRSTLVTAHYGRHNDVGNAFIADRGNPFQVANNYAFNTATGRFDYQNSSGGSGGQRFAENLTAPSVDEVAAGVKREVIAQTVVGIDYTYRRYSNMWTNQEVNQIWDPAGLRVIGYANGMRQQIFQATTDPDAFRRYHGLDLWVKGSPGNFDITASYTLAYSDGTVSDFFDGDFKRNPRLAALFYGPQPDNYRHYLKGLFDYRFDFGLHIGARFQYLTGASQWKVFQSPQDSSFSLYRSPRGTTTGSPNATTTANNNNNPVTWSDFKLPDQFNMDLQASFDFQPLTKQRIDLYVQFFNVLNLATGTRLETRDNANFGTVTSRLTPFNAQVVLRYRY